MDPRLDELLIRVKDISVDIRDLVKQGAIHNEVLKEHEKRSTQLEHRVDPLEKDKEFRNKLYSTVLGMGALAASILSVLKFIKTI